MKSHSISTQIRLAVLLTALGAVLATALACWAVVQYLVRSTADERAVTLAKLIASHAPAILSLPDKERGSELLAAAATAHHLVSARIVDRHGVTLASYRRDRSLESDLGLRWGEAAVLYRVTFGGEEKGLVEVNVDRSLVATIPILFVLACVGVASIFLLDLWLVARPIERARSKPLSRLSMYTRKIRETENYSLRIPAIGVREMRGLVEDINALLAQMDKSAAAHSDRSFELSKLAYFDELTGAANRTRFRDRLGRSVAAYRRHGTPFALIGIDLDHFKQLNDTLGHHIGDRYLREMARRCLATIRSQDTFARMGGR